MYESQLKRKVIKSLSQIPFLAGYYCSIFNEGKRKTESCPKSLGLVAGVSDILITYPTRVHVGLWMELKTESNTKGATIKQIEWLDNHARLNWGTAVAIGYEEAMTVIFDYLDHQHILRR